MSGSLYTTATSAQGFIPLTLDKWLLIATNDIPAIAVASGNGGKLASDTAPALKRVNGATDKCLTIDWAASSSVEITQGFCYPPDMDVTAAYTVNLRVKMAGATDTPTIAIGVFEGIGDTNRGATSGAASATLGTVSASVTPTGGHPNFASVSLTPGAHTTDILHLYEAYILYKKKLLAS